ncbi:MAG: GNAT family N-acetyltransferase [Thiobacillaceae bacterium]|jgi:predicted GNAT family N-acyltransferase|nr:GNAT family N-acetyltransferase [Thiobacillaceae bacterium]
MADFRILISDWRSDRQRLSQIRRAVFIEEQGVPEELEWDDEDAGAIHLLAVDADGTPIGCARLLPDGHIGRMAVLQSWRRKGVGRALLHKALEVARAQGHAIVRLSAQTHAAGFYRRHGFIAQGHGYLEAGIPHLAMEISFS